MVKNKAKKRYREQARGGVDRRVSVLLVTTDSQTVLSKKERVLVHVPDSPQVGLGFKRHLTTGSTKSSG